ncbi:MAG: LEA type 2 family protein [Flavobacteriales bacterium]|nr:LEA type 2 family protein [Flavobacteriales bacterium]
MKIRVLLYISIFLLLSSCMTVKPLEIRSVVCCDLKKAMQTEAEVAFMVELHNPNDFPVNVKSYCLDVRLNNNTLGTAESKEFTEIEPNKTLKKSITLRTSAQKLVSGSLTMGLSALLKNDLSTLEVEIVGSVVGNAKGFSKRVRIREKYPLKLNP